jgi:hypothetical protein
MRSVGEAIQYTEGLCAGPALFMFVGGLLVCLKEPPDTFVYATQVMVEKAKSRGAFWLGHCIPATKVCAESRGGFRAHPPRP